MSLTFDDVVFVIDPGFAIRMCLSHEIMLKVMTAKPTGLFEWIQFLTLADRKPLHDHNKVIKCMNSCVQKQNMS